VSSCRCLGEGVDLPSVDMVAFTDPKSSLIDIVQATGRCLRVVEGKESGIVFVPIFIPEGVSDEEAATMNAKLVLILANHIGDRALIRAAILAACGKIAAAPNM
jgi:predicted helicase